MTSVFVEPAVSLRAAPHASCSLHGPARANVNTPSAARVARAGRRAARIAAAADGTSGGSLDSVQQRALQIKSMKATANYLELLKNEEEDFDLDDDEEVVARSLGLRTKAELSPSQRKYADRIAQSLAEKAKALERKEAEERKAMLVGQRMFEVGQYDASVEVFEKALQEAGERTTLGGEVALWLALAYDASGRRDDALRLYVRLEETHPSSARTLNALLKQKVKKQAYGLRYILEAPELEISPEERVQLPVGVATADGYSDKWSRNAPPKRKIKMTWEEEFWQKYEPPEYFTNRFALAATSIVSLGVAIYSAMHIRPH